MNDAAPANFDPLARIYRPLEWLAFGRDLKRARFCLLDRLAACRSILVLGEGDGRCLARLLDTAPAAHIDCLDASAAMLARAKARLAGHAGRPRVRFTQADARRHSFPSRAYDAVVTCFFLDCFDTDDAAALVAAIAHALVPNSRWLYADFAVPARGLARWRARAWLALLYAFFRQATHLRAHQLPPAEMLIASAGFAPIEERSRQHGLLRTVLFRRGTR